MSYFLKSRLFYVTLQKNLCRQPFARLAAQIFLTASVKELYIPFSFDCGDLTADPLLRNIQVLGSLMKRATAGSLYATPK